MHGNDHLADQNRLALYLHHCSFVNSNITNSHIMRTYETQQPWKVPPIATNFKHIITYLVWKGVYVFPNDFFFRGDFKKPPILSATNQCIPIRKPLGSGNALRIKVSHNFSCIYPHLLFGTIGETRSQEIATITVKRRHNFIYRRVASSWTASTVKSSPLTQSPPA